MEIFRHSLATQQIFSPDTNEPLEFQTVLTGWPIECYISRQKHGTTCRFVDELPNRQPYNVISLGVGVDDDDYYPCYGH